MSEIISTEQAALRAKVTRKSICRHLAKGTIKGFKEDGSRLWNVYVDSLEKYYYKTKKGEKQHNSIHRRMKKTERNIIDIMNVQPIKSDSSVLYEELFNEFSKMQWVDCDINDVRNYLYKLAKKT